MINNKNEESTNKTETKEPIVLAIIKSVGLILCLGAFYEFGIWIGIGVGLIDLIIILILKETVYSESEIIKHGTRNSAFKGLVILSFIISLIVIAVLFSRSLFEGFIALVAVIILIILIQNSK